MPLTFVLMRALLSEAFKLRRAERLVNVLAKATRNRSNSRMSRGRRRTDRLRPPADSGTLPNGMTRRLVALAVVGILGCNPILADADPPDPTWIAGFWDNADLDDIVVRITLTSSVAEMNWACSLEPHWFPIWILLLTDDRPAPSVAAAPHHPRGPPLV